MHYYAWSTSPNNLPAEQRLLAERLQSAFSFVLLPSPFFFTIHHPPPPPPSPAQISQGKASQSMTFPSSLWLEGDSGQGKSGRDGSVRHSLSKKPLLGIMGTSLVPSSPAPLLGCLFWSPGEVRAGAARAICKGPPGQPEGDSCM